MKTQIIVDLLNIVNPITVFCKNYLARGRLYLYDQFWTSSWQKSKKNCPCCS